MSDQRKDSIVSVIDALSNSFIDINKDQATKLFKENQIQYYKNLLHSDFENFIYNIFSSMDGFWEIVLDNFADKPRLKFLIQKHEKIENHFNKIIVKQEGSPCCYDKSGTIMTKIFNYLDTGQEIVFDYSQKYTFHYPKAVFENGDNILEFFEALYFLENGQGDRYVNFINKNNLI